MRLFGKGNSRRLLVLLVSLTLVGAACGGDDDDTEQGGETGETQEGGTLVFGADQEIAGFNTGTSKDNTLAGGQIMRMVWSSAFRARPDFSMEPYAVASASVVSEDPFTVEWKIRPEANWSDGTPVSADDFEYFWQMCNGSQEEADCATTSGYDLITTFDKPDPKTFRTEFSQGYVDYQGIFTNVPPSHIAKERAQAGDLVAAWNTAFDTDAAVSNGPFMVSEYEKGESLTLVRNDKFWGKKPSLDRIIFRFLPESLTQPDALRNAEVKMIYPQPQLDQVEIVEELPGVHSEINFGPTFEHLTFNFNNEFLKIREVRQAIAAGVDRGAIVERLMKPFSDKAAQLDNRVLVATQKGYEAHGSEYAKRDVAKAKGFLQKAGFTEGAGGVFEKDGKPLRLRLSTTAENDLRTAQGVLVQAQLKEVGFDIRIENFPSASLGPTLSEGNFDIINFAWVGTPFPSSGAYQIYESKSGSNFGKYVNTNLDKMMLEALGVTDEAKRTELLNTIDETLWTDLPNLPLYQKPTFLAYSEEFVNISDNTTTESPFWNAEEWALKATAQ